MNHWALQEQADILILRPTRSGRVADGLRRGVLVGVAVGGFATLFFLASLLGPNPIDWKVQVLSGAILGVLFGILTGFARFGREDLWILDRSRNVLSWESRAIASSLRSVEFPLGDVEEIRANGSRLEVVWKNGELEPLADIGEEKTALEIVARVQKYLA